MGVKPGRGGPACAPLLCVVGDSRGAPLKGWYGADVTPGVPVAHRVPAHPEHSEIHFDVALSGLCALCRNATREQPKQCQHKT
jgi:hypothetical protein